MDKTDLYSKIIAGTMTWGSWGKQLSTDGMRDLMHHCLASGITTFDHADIYGDYGNEEAFGAAFSGSGIAREDIQLITKCGIQHVKGRPNHVKHYQYDKDYIIWSAERSLECLKTDYLDLFLLHRPSPLMHPMEIAEAVEHLMDQGKIKQFGVSNFTPSQIAMVESAVGVSANQVEYSMTHDAPMYDGTFDDCIAANRMAMAWSPLGGYFREDDDRTARIKAALTPMLEKYDANESQLLLAFIMKHPVSIHPVVGTANKERLVDSMKAAEIDMELTDWFTLLAASQGHKVP
ncbi:aldo/keto reductase [Flagellimonas sp. DF-77]|uniref:aldo/keto reductase n=1 Tax=Flagellimonas algarum TaxID=3230298 RepID=UPI003399C73A